MNFYDKTPAGRIINRMSNDMLAIDEALPLTISLMFSSLATLLGSLISIVIQLPYSILSYFLILKRFNFYVGFIVCFALVYSS